ncbi:leucine-rich repeat domain-containing protein [Pseudomonas izuensis]|uniref:leucine-rich repeat domain-containing protein n=1 Tax=Pseudomonas izuensis TaxID=2684212 RepID=UPI00135CECA9|nr:leucine-rich repeat domain-containing protein [Pseudomonas izuensis]
MNEFSDNPISHPHVRDELKSAVETDLPQTPSQFGEQMIKEKWGRDLDPQTAQLVTLHYDYRHYPDPDGSHQGYVARSRSLVQALLSDYQTVGDGRFGETAFGLYTPPDVGPSVHLVDKESLNDDLRTYEGIYRSTVPQSYGPKTQINLRPADFKQWIWALNFKDLYQAYVDKAWPSDEVLLGVSSYPLRISAKAAFIMSAWLQRHENSLSRKALGLAMRAAGLPPDQAWEALTMQQLQAPTRIPSSVETSRLKLYRYTATDIWCFRDRASGRVLLYIPGNSSPLHDFADSKQLRRWIIEQGKVPETKQALAAHFEEEDRTDGTFHAGVLTALDGMVVYPRQHHLTREAGFFNDDGYWDPDDYIGYDLASEKTDPFAQMVWAMKRAAQASVETIRDDAQVNRDDLSAVIEPIVQWVNQFGPLALFVPGGEGLLVLAGLIDAGFGLDQAINGETADMRSQGVTRTVFGLLNALPLAAGVASLSGEGVDVARLAKTEATGGEPSAGPLPGSVETGVPVQPVLPLPSRIDLLRGVGAPAGTFSDEVLAQIGRVSAVDDDMLRLMQAGREPTPLLADTIDRFRIDQEVAGLSEPSIAPSELFNRRYQALQRSEHEWVRLFQRQYPGLPKAAVEQMLDRYGVDFKAAPEVARARQLFRQLDSKARQYQQHVRLNRAYEGLYLRSVASPESDTLALHSLKNLPGWPKTLRIEVLDGSPGGRVLDRCGPLEARDGRRLIKMGDRYQPFGLSTQTSVGTDFYEALVGILTEEEHSALQLLSGPPAAGLKLAISDHPLSRSELALGLGRKDSGLPFEAQGLRGGGYPGTPQESALTHSVMRLQLKDIYPEFTDEEADAMLQQLGGEAQAHIDRSRRELQQLYVDLDTWVDLVADDVEDLDIDHLQMGDPGTEGLTQQQIEMRNAERLQETITYEREVRGELGDELVAIFQKRPPQRNSHYSGNHIDGFTMNMSHEDFHRLPELNARFNDVVELNLENFHLFERETLNGFLGCFPKLRSLNLEGTDLRLPNDNGELESSLPSTIPQLRHLVSLNLSSTELRFQENTAAQLSQLINLQSLDLSENPLGVPPVVLGMDQLRTLKLNDTRIRNCPVGIMERPYLATLDLRNNQINRVPQAVLNQAIARDRVLLWNNPLTDEDTLQRLVRHREQTGINLWLSSPGASYSDPAAWLRDLPGEQQDAHLQIWHRLALKRSGMRFLGTINTLSLTPDFLVGYPGLQARVWRLLNEADTSDQLWEQLVQVVPRALASTDNPFVVFTAMEDRARLHAHWVAMGQPFPVGEHQP